VLATKGYAHLGKTPKAPQLFEDSDAG
jgi:hypothetical protein